MPRAVTVHTASALLGRSPRAVRQLVADGVLPTMRGGVWRRIPLSALEAFRGSRVDPVEYMQAQASLEKTRSHWRTAGQRRRAAEAQPAVSGSMANPQRNQQ
jgi:excisionase family DNA binding protein